MKKQKSLTQLYFYSMTLLSVLISFLLGGLWISQEVNQFKKESAAAKKEYIDSQKELLKSEVTSAVTYIEYQKSFAEQRLKKEVKSRTLEAYNTAFYIYEKQKDRKPLVEIKQMVHDALFSASWDDGKGYYFAEDMKGTELVNRNNPELEGKNIIDIQDSKGNYLMRDILAVANSPQREGFCSYYWNKPENPNVHVPKISYVKYFEPFDWVIGNGKYLDDQEKEIKEEILSRISQMRVGSDGYFFIGTWEGVSVLGPPSAMGKNLLLITDSNGVQIVQELITAAKSGGGFVHYIMPKFEGTQPLPKISYAMGLPDWQWYIGTGVYLDEIEKVIQQNQARLNGEIKSYIFQIIAFLCLLVLLVNLLARLATRKIQKNLDLFSRFFEKAATNSLQIDQKKAFFSEFQSLANSANQMIEQRQKAEKEKEQLETKLGQAQKMKAIGLMAGGVAHDLNNILSGIVNYPELMLMKLPKESELRPSLKSLHEAGLRAAQVVSDLLTVARGAAISKKICSLNKLVEEFAHSPECTKILSQYPAINVRTELSTDLFNISCSPLHIQKSLMNLILNAAEAITGSGEIFISTANKYIDKPIAQNQYLPKGEYALLQVSDNGQGISSVDLEHIFEPFYTKKVMGKSGTGLGLAIVWNTAQDHGGGVSVASGGKGTTFTLYFPATRDQLDKELKDIETENLQGNGERILIVDDEKQQQIIASKLLTSLGYQVHTVGSGQEAIQYLHENTADLVVLDMILGPGINGCQTYEQIAKINPGQKAVIASGFSASAEVFKAQDLGAGQFLKKPYTLKQIGLAVKQTLRQIN
ncbi:MAG: cache domain-containing protein [Desulfobulbaceae bacterium]|nr:cache domain-containing protein [Desulfobulbaceae bacterium]